MKCLYVKKENSVYGMYMRKNRFFYYCFFISSILFASVFLPVLASVDVVVEDSWSTITPPSNYPSGRPGTVIFDGKIYFIGANVINDYTDPGYVECYDPKTDTWITLTPMPTPRAGVSLVEYQNKIYCIGGEVPNFGSVFITRSLDVVEVYDPFNDAWSKKASLPFEGALTACVVNEQLFVITHNGCVYVYDPYANSWSSKTFLPANVRDVRVCVVNEQLFVIAQNGENGLWELWLYDISGDSWAKKASPSFALEFKFTVVDDKIMVCDHQITNMHMGSVKLNISIYDPETDKWSVGKSGPKSMVFYGYLFVGTTSGVYAPKSVYVFGYEQIDLKTHQAFTWVYDPIKNAWSTAKTMPAYTVTFRDVEYIITARPISDQGSDKLFVVNDIFYLMGPSDFNLQYVPIGYSTDSQTSIAKHLNSSETAIIVITVVITIVFIFLLFLLLLRPLIKNSKKSGNIAKKNCRHIAV